MRLQFSSPKGEPSVKINAVFYPVLLLAIIPFASALVLTILFSHFDFYKAFFQFIAITNPEQMNALLAALISSLVPGLLFYYIYTFRYGTLTYGSVMPLLAYLTSGRKSAERKFMERKDSRIQINLYDVLNRILFAEIVVLIVITILLYLIPESTENSTYAWLLVVKAFFHFMQIMLIIPIYIIFLYFLPSYLTRDFRFIMAKKCMDVANEEKDKAEKINYLIAGLSSYKKYLKRNLGLEFDDTRVASNIISSSSDKNEIVETIEKSFNEDSLDKLKPASCLSTFANLEPKEQFLINKQLSTRIKEIGIFLATIIPVLITVIQLVFPSLFPKPP
jgi:hypothetical protein